MRGPSAAGAVLAAAFVSVASGSPPPPPAPTSPSAAPASSAFPCLNASSPAFNGSACAPREEVEEQWVVWKLHSTVAVVVGGVVLAVLIAVAAFILHHRQRRRKLLQRASSGYSATSFNSSINEAAAQEAHSHANPALHTCDVYDVDEFSLDNDSFLHTLESFEGAHRHGPPGGASSYGRMRGPAAIIHPSSSAAVGPAPISKLPPSTLDPLSVLSITPATSTISSAGSVIVTKTLNHGDL